MSDIETFEDLGLTEETLKALKDSGYTKPTPIQAQAIPHILMARDLVGLAQTGTGKTASFTLPMIDILSTGRAKARMPRSLVLAPTRELAAQVAENFDKYGKYHNLTKVLLVGGVSMGEQIKQLDKGVDVLIATPGRLLDLFDRGMMMLADMKILVIDEADRMLDMGFIPDIEKIVSKLPPMRQTLLFSATMPNEVKRLTEKFLSNPRTVSVSAPATASAMITQNLTYVQQRDKKKVLTQIIKQEKVANAFIFCNRKRDIADLCAHLNREGFTAAAMHGDLVQKTRTETLAKFKNNEITMLVCSDVAARGLDVQGVSHVFNFDIPMHADDYVHRIGRTGRAGLTGVSWSLATKDDDKYVKEIEKITKSTLPVVEVGASAKSRPAPKTPEAAPQEKTQNKPHENKAAKPRPVKNAVQEVKSVPVKSVDDKANDKTAANTVDNHEQPLEIKRADHKASGGRLAKESKLIENYEKPNANNKGRNPRYKDDEPSDVVGFGDDLPSFMR
jgi:superfamily II DNA/RNA helicase